MASSSASKESASLADFMQLLRLRWTLIALISAIVIATTLAVTAFLPSWYLATSKIRVEKPESEVKLFQAQAYNGYDPYFLQDQFKIMQSEKILYPVIENLGLNARLAASVGSSVPLSLTPAPRLIADSHRSPTWPAMLAATQISAACHNATRGIR